MNLEQAVRDFIESFERLSQVAEAGSDMAFRSADSEHAQVTLDLVKALEAEGAKVPYGLKAYAEGVAEHYG